MVSIDEVLSWKPARLSDVADAVSRHRKSLQDVVSDQLPQGEPPAIWVGADADAARAAHEELSKSLDGAVSPLGAVVTALDAAATACGQAKSDVEAALDAARGGGYEVNTSTGEITDPRTYDDPTELAQARSRLSALVAQLSAALTEATTADDNLATALEQAQSGIAAVGGDLTDTQQLIDEVDSGHVDAKDAKAALQLPMSCFSKAGRAALQRWVSGNGLTVASWIAHGDPINLPPSPLGYDFTIPAIDTPNVKLEYELNIPPGTGASGLSVEGSTSGRPSLSGTLASGGASTSVGDDGWTASAMQTVGQDQVGVSWEPDGPWIKAEHESDVQVGNQPGSLTTTLSVRAPMKPPTSDPKPEPWYDTALHDVESVPGKVVHGVGTLASDAWDGWNSLPAGAKIAVGAGLVLVATGGGGAMLAPAAAF